MDRTIKLFLGVIAASLVLLNLQLAGVKLEDVSLVSEAHAELGRQEAGLLSDSLDGIASAIRTIECSH